MSDGRQEYPKAVGPTGDRLARDADDEARILAEYASVVVADVSVEDQAPAVKRRKAKE